jgi:TrmH family RNA methyltransferase
VSAEFPLICSARNPRLKQAIKLRQPRARANQSRILIDGQREIALALGAGVRVEEIFVEVRRAGERGVGQWLEACADRGVQIWTLPAELLGKLGYGGRDDQCVATARPPQRTLADLRLPESPLVVVLEGIEKPGNMGAIVRTADAAGAHAVIAADGRTDVFNPNAIRASRGTIFTTPVCAASTADTMNWLSAGRMQVYVARVDAERSYDQADFRPGSAIVLGSETEGVSAPWRAPSFQAIRLPMSGRADSLNVAATAAVLLYEANRQRRQISRLTP